MLALNLGRGGIVFRSWWHWLYVMVALDLGHGGLATNFGIINRKTKNIIFINRDGVVWERVRLKI